MNTPVAPGPAPGWVGERGSEATEPTREAGAHKARRPARAEASASRQRRWHRAVIPFAVALLLVAVSRLAYIVDEPDWAEPGTFSPAGTGPDGSSRLADLLAQRGVTIERHTRSTDVVAAALAGDVTVFVPAPQFARPLLAAVLSTLPESNRIVLVEPNLLGTVALPVTWAPPRWAARAVPPGCDLPAPRQAGRATALRTSYEPHETGQTCYDGGLVSVQWEQLEVVVVGASDPFRNSRIGEHGNAELAAGLLSGKPRVLWLDLHAAEPVPFSRVETGGIVVDLPGEQDDDGGGGPPNPLWTAAPAAFWPSVVALLIAAVLLAAWRARRLGPPVPEPLPIVVPAAETVTGRGRLYERAAARGPTLDALSSAARQRIATVYGLPPDADVVEPVAERTGLAKTYVQAVLHPGEPADDGQLLQATAALDALLAAAVTERKAPAR